MAKIEVNKKDSKVVIRVAGQFDYQCHREFRDAYRYEPESAIYEIDLHRTEMLDSAALGMLLLLRWGVCMCLDLPQYWHFFDHMH